MLAVFKKEIRHYLTTLTGYLFIGFFICIVGVTCTLHMFYRNGDYSQVITSQIVVIFALFFGIPIVTMGLLAEEKKNKTDQMLITAPINIQDIVLGKYLSAVVLFLTAFAITISQPLLLSRFGSLPYKKIMNSYLGVALLGCTLLAIGLLLSALSNNQMIAAVITYVTFFGIMFADSFILTLPKDRNNSTIFILLLVLLVSVITYFVTKNIWIAIGIGILGISIVLIILTIHPMVLDGIMVKILRTFSLMNPFKDFAMGIFQVKHIIYYLSISIICIYLAIQVIENRRWN